MNYGIYKNVRNASWQCLIDCNIQRLPVSVGEICRCYGLPIIENSECRLLPDGTSGMIMSVKGNVKIIVNDRESKQRCRFTAAHELGHYLLGHLGTDERDINRARAKVKPEVETQADMFAARLLAPACVLWGLNLHTAEEIAAVCNISLSAAQFRAERMKELYRRNRFLQSPTERQVFEQFKNFIVEKK